MTHETREQWEQRRVDEHLAIVRNVISIQNGWIKALLACEIPDKTYNDCKNCNNPQCRYAWGKLQTLWPEIGDWPPQPRGGQR